MAIKKTRKFNGKTYSLVTTVQSKSRVNKYKSEAKRKKLNLRVVKAKSGKKTVYRIYGKK